MALIIEHDNTIGHLEIKGYYNSTTAIDQQTKRTLYLADAVNFSQLPDQERSKISNFLLGTVQNEPIKDEKAYATYATKKYKPVALKVKPIYAELPDEYRIKRNIQGDPLATIPKLNPNPEDFIPTERYTKERKEAIDKVHIGNFLWPEERKLMHHLIMLQNQAFAWDDSERGRFRTDFFPPVVIPTVEHTPWVYKNIPIPAGIFDEVCRIVQQKIAAGVYEPSNASYRSRWFTVAKKDGKSLRIVHSLEPLNAITIAHSGVPPATEELASKFAGRSCGGMLDLYVGYDERLLAEKSRDLTTFQTPYGALRLVTLPMGWTNSVPIFHDDVTEILKPEIPEYTIPYIDDVPIKGPSTRYETETGYETIPENRGIRRFVWEHMNNVNRILQRMKYCGGTFSGKKTLICSEAIEVVGHKCDYEGRKPTEDRIDVIMRWESCKDVSEVRSFLGITGVLRAYIPNYGLRAHELQRLVRKDIPFEWGSKQIASMNLVKDGVKEARAIRPLNYQSEGTIVLAVDTSYIGIGYYIYQEDPFDSKKVYYAKFGSKPLNEREARFSQPKRELFGLKEALRLNKKWLFGVRRLVVETDAKYIKGMLENPDMMPNATINRWIDEILLYHFTIRHKAGATFGPDGLSRRSQQPSDPPIDPCSDDEEDIPNIPKVEIVDATEPGPLPILDFVDKIDSRGGYFQKIAGSTDDFLAEIQKADIQRNLDREIWMSFNRRSSGDIDQRAKYVQQFIDVLSLPLEGSTDLPYSEEHRSKGAMEQDQLMPHIEQLMKDRSYKPEEFTEKQIERLKRLVNRFLIYNNKIYRRVQEGQHRLYVPKDRRTYMMTAAHDHNGHRGFFATRALLVKRFWWPEMERDINQFVKTCHPCQERQLQLVRIPPFQTYTPSIFEILHADIMHMTPASNGCKLIVHGRCRYTSWPEARAIKDEKARTIAHWIYEDILCRWGGLRIIVTDNGESFKAAAQFIAQKWNIKHITISPYNSKANGTIERPHWDIRQMLYKATGVPNINKWYWFLNSVLWADRITIRKRTGHSPYYLVTGTHPILPLDLAEATWLVEFPNGALSESDLIGLRARALAKHRAHTDQMRKRIDRDKIKRVQAFEKEFKTVIKNYKFTPGDLVLVRNTAIENSLDKKMKPRYFGPMIVVKENKGGSYILAELTGAVWHQKVAKFRVVPYFARKKIQLTEEVKLILDMDRDALSKLDSLPEPEDYPSRDYLMDNVTLEIDEPDTFEDLFE